MPKNSGQSGYKYPLHCCSIPKPASSAFSISSKATRNTKLTHKASGQRERKEASRGAMEYGYPYTGCSSNKEKRPPLKRGQLKLQIAKTLLGSHVVPAGATNRDRSFGR
ncbi:uncharacterized protein LOC133910151 [Phragmites australis]|uniref:uncharacterized protein LOC133910151 n=1 Tax=Phragmites australis TaxID=29695 RepID=UPI002D78C29A|nr:uncharacterized protein LOC133910151 [Phragmites australis]